MNSVLFVVTEDWALYSHRFHLIQDAIKRGFKVSLATNCSVYCEMFQKAGVSVYHLPQKRKSLNPFSAIIVVIRLLLIIVKVKPDLVHAVAIKPVVFAGLALKLCSKPAAVFALWGVGYIFSSKLEVNLLRFSTTMFLKFAMSASRTALILQNKDDIALFSKFRLVDERQIFIQGAGVETEVFNITISKSCYRNFACSVT